MAIQVGFPQTSQDLLTLYACAAAAFPPCHNDRLHPNLLVPPKSYNDFNINHPPSLPTFQSSALPFENHDHEIDRYIKLQGEKLSMKLQERTRQQVATILNAVELSMLNSMWRKDEEIAWAAQKSIELQDLLNRVEAENQVWRRAALESEAMVLSLNNSLEKMKEKAQCGIWVDEAQSCCDESGGDYKRMREEEEEATGENAKDDACKSCNCGRSCFLILPCRHLCACEACEPFLQACPVCAMPKKASIEALIF